MLPTDESLVGRRPVGSVDLGKEIVGVALLGRVFLNKVFAVESVVEGRVVSAVILREELGGHVADARRGRGLGRPSLPCRGFTSCDLTSPGGVGAQPVA